MIKKRCEKIAVELSCYYSEEKNPGLMSGLAGISCFFFHYYRFSGNENYKRLGYLALQNIFDTIENGFSDPSFANGLGGIHWMLKYLGSQGFITTEEANSLNKLNPLLQNYSRAQFKKGDYDTLHGGLGIYFIEKINISANHRAGKHNNSREILEIIKNGLSINIKQEDENSLYWKTTNPISGEEEINFGLAHGIPSILIFLSWLYQISGDKNILTDMIEPGMNFLLKNNLKTSSDLSLFPICIKNGVTIKPSRMAWCYGDPGIASAIFEIGENCNRMDWLEISKDILIQASKRRSKVETGVSDACICHGSAGLALIYYNAGLRTGYKPFMNTARFWLQTTLAFGNDEEGSAGYLFKEQQNKFIPKYGFLEGIAGVGLTLMAMTAGRLPGWEKGLMI